MVIRIVADSTCDIPDELVERHGITIVPLYINIGEESYLDGVDLSREAFYEGLPDYKVSPTTAAPGPDTFRQVYERLADEGATEILSMHISVSLSNTVNVAQMGAAQTKGVPVTVLDTRQLSLGAGFMVLRAAQAAAEGRSVEEIVDIVEEQIGRTHVAAMLDTLEYLKRSGRMSAAVARLGTILRVKPLLRMYDGTPHADKVRTSERATQRLIGMLRDCAPVEQLAIVHAHSPERAEALRQRIAEFMPDDEVLSVDITPVLGAHLGPNTVGFAAVCRGGED
jgi:DegV family protein with EDD domain